MDRSTLWYLLGALACLGLFAILFLAAVGIVVLGGTQRARGAFDRWMTPDPQALADKLADRRRRQPGLDDPTLVRSIIAGQALKAGLVGAATGLGGIATLPIAIPIDFALSARIQAGLIHFVQQTYAPGMPTESRRLQTYALMAGQAVAQQAMEQSTRVAQAAVARLLRRMLAQTVAESLLKIVPFVGAAIGFAFNYATTRAAGELAAKWYRSRQQAGQEVPYGD